MRLPTKLLGLPASLLLLISTHLEAHQPARHPTAVRKMGLDEGEKFFPHYIAFPVDDGPKPLRAVLSARRLPQDDESVLLAANSSAALPYRAPFAPHTADDGDDEAIGDEAVRRRTLWRRGREALARLQRRKFACPSGTDNCDNIGHPNSCCADGETCVEIEDTGLGPVGCCREGATCAGTITTCPEGHTACSSEQGGGCCIPGFVCAGVGCVPKAATRSASVTTLTSTSTWAVSNGNPTTVVVVVTITSTPAQPTRTSTSTRVIPPSQTPTSTPTATDARPPSRPTATSDESDGRGTTGLVPSDYCPTGFYACVASAGGGCCRTGRDCQTTSCPPVSYKTVTTEGATVVVPATAAPRAGDASSTCAGGWFLCGKEAGPVAGCCPSGYACGTASCSVASGTATGAVQKQLPSAGSTGAVDARVVLVGVLGWSAVLLSVVW